MKRTKPPTVRALIVVLIVLSGQMLSARSTTPAKGKPRPVKPTLKPLELPDFVVTGLVCVQEPQGGWYYPNKIVRRLKATLKNNGKAYDGPLDFRLVALEKLQGGFTFDRTFSISKISLAKGEQTEMRLWMVPPQFRWPEPWNEHPSLSFVLYIDPAKKVRQVNRKDNTFTKTITWPHITVTHPNGGEILEPGKTCVIRWTKWQVAGNVKIFAEQCACTGSSLNKGRSISENAPNTGRFSWQIPSGKRKWPAGYYKIRVTSMDDRLVFDNSDEVCTLVGYVPPDWATPEVRINPQNVDVAVTKTGRIKPKNRFRRTNPNHQVNFEIGWNQDLDVEFRIPLEYLGLEKGFRVSMTITFGSDNPALTATLKQQFPQLFVKKEAFRVKQGTSTKETKFGLKAQALQMLQANNKPITVDILIASPGAKWKTTYKTFIRLLEPKPD
jgi:hypothetical protein